MSGPVGHTFIYNIMILFIVIVFAFLAGTMSYYKAFKVNNKIILELEKFEGYNDLSKEKIDQYLSNMGYQQRENHRCSGTYRDMELVSLNDERYKYCIYIGTEESVDDTRPNCREYYLYGVVTYMSLDLPLINLIQLPVFTRTNRIYKFTTSGTCL